MDNLMISALTVKARYWNSPKFVQEYAPTMTQYQCLLRTGIPRIYQGIQYVHEIFELLTRTQNTAQNNVFVVVQWSSQLTMNKNTHQSRVFMIDFKYVFLHRGSLIDDPALQL